MSQNTWELDGSGTTEERDVRPNVRHQVGAWRNSGISTATVKWEQLIKGVWVPLCTPADGKQIELSNTNQNMPGFVECIPVGAKIRASQTGDSNMHTYMAEEVNE